MRRRRRWRTRKEREMNEGKINMDEDGEAAILLLCAVKYKDVNGEQSLQFSGIVEYSIQ